jgi:hypothetical protein
MADTAKRYNLVLPVDLYTELSDLAKARNTSVVDLLRTYTKLGIWLTKELDATNSQLIIRNDEKEREILIF